MRYYKLNEIYVEYDELRGNFYHWNPITRIGKKICIEEGETEPTPEECWQAFKQYYPGDYEEAMKIKRGEK